MIQLTRLNNQALIVNSDLIKFVETAPDTVLTLVSGEKILVRESPEEVLARVVEFRRGVMARGTPNPLALEAAQPGRSEAGSAPEPRRGARDG